MIHDGLIAPSQRTYYRTEQGSVMCWYDRGEYKETLILDSKYRTLSKWSSTHTLVGESEHTKGYGYIGSNKSNVYSDPILSLQDNAKFFTDNDLDNCIFYKDPYSAKHNKQIVCNNTAYNSLKDATLVIPNIQTLVRIYCDGEFIDKLDPTVKDFPQFKLYDGWFKSDTLLEHCWSSTEMDFYYMWTITSRGLVCGVGKNDLIGGIIPVKELI